MKRYCRSYLVLLIFVAGVCISLSTSAHALTTTHYTLSSTTISSLRIVQLTDLHNSVFGEENSRLIDAVRDQSPDLILLTGDLLNSDEQCTDIATDLIAKLCDIAPGNVSISPYHGRRAGKSRILYAVCRKNARAPAAQSDGIS